MNGKKTEFGSRNKTTDTISRSHKWVLGFAVCPINFSSVYREKETQNNIECRPLQQNLRRRMCVLNALLEQSS